MIILRLANKGEKKMPNLICPNCSNQIEWDGGSGNFPCLHCGGVVTVPQYFTVFSSMSNGMTSAAEGATAIINYERVEKAKS